MGLEVHFASAKTEWETPPVFFAELDKEFNFTLDVCASDENTKVPQHYFTVKEDGLTQDWSKDVCWMNPPYGREIIKWVEKAYQESLKGATVVCLLPSRTDTKWYHEYVTKAKEVRFLRGRIKFVGAANSAPFPSCIVVFSV